MIERIDSRIDPHIIFVCNVVLRLHAELQPTDLAGQGGTAVHATNVIWTWYTGRILLGVVCLERTRRNAGIARVTGIEHVELKALNLETARG